MGNWPLDFLDFTFYSFYLLLARSQALHFYRNKPTALLVLSSCLPHWSINKAASPKRFSIMYALPARVIQTLWACAIRLWRDHACTCIVTSMHMQIFDIQNAPWGKADVPPQGNFQWSKFPILGYLWAHILSQLSNSYFNNISQWFFKYNLLNIIETKLLCGIITVHIHTFFVEPCLALITCNPTRKIFCASGGFFKVTYCMYNYFTYNYFT
jgi:hypothetical protein